MSKFITYTESSGQIYYVKRKSIDAFLPLFIRQNLYRTYGIVGEEKIVLKDHESHEEAKAWVEDQIQLIENEDEQRPNRITKDK